MLLSHTNNSLQQCISSSDSSSLIGLHCNPEHNACMKANSYKVGNDSKVGNDCTSPVPTKVQVLMPAIPLSQCPTRSNQVPGCLSRLVTFHCQKVMQWQLDLLWIFMLAPLKEGTSREEEAQPNALAPDHLQWLWKHSNCYNLQKVQTRAMETVQVTLLSTRRHQDEALWSIWSLPILLWFPWRLQSAWTSLSGSRSSHCWERHSQCYTMHGEKIIMIIQRRRVSWIHRGC